MKNTLILMAFIATFGAVHAQNGRITELKQTTEMFQNKEFVWNVQFLGQKVGEFWPIHGLNLVTKDADPQFFDGTTDISTIQAKLRGVATAPDGMTGGSFGSYQLQGKCLSKGRPCGDGYVYQYGVVCVSKTGFSFKFTHANEGDFNALYEKTKADSGTLFFLPSIFREGRVLQSIKEVDKVLVRRNTPTGEQIGIIIFDGLATYDLAREIVLGLDRDGKSQTTHIYVLDGGESWGQSCKEINGVPVLVGTRNPNVVTNYLVLY